MFRQQHDLNNVAYSYVFPAVQVRNFIYEFILAITVLLFVNYNSKKFYNF